MNSNNKKIILGLMSGTSLDGLDLALCSFENIDEKYSYEIIETKTIAYSSDIRSKLLACHEMSPFDFISFHKEYGFYIGERINEFLKEEKIMPDYIASHGHTIFHQPEKKITFQIGDGVAISAATGISVISDFRNLDVCLGGQGAPLVPVGDMLLFSEFQYCVNIGGFANVSYNNRNDRVAYDICPANIILNEYASYFNQEFDKEGEIGRSGSINLDLLKSLNEIEFYQIDGPKSLGREWLEEIFLPVISKDINKKDIMRTLYEHISQQISIKVTKIAGEVLITGGGVHNTFLIELLRDKCRNRIIIPDNQLIDFKEALIFGFLGYLYVNNNNNCLKTVTGAKVNSIGGSLVLKSPPEI